MMQKLNTCVKGINRLSSKITIGNEDRLIPHYSTQTQQNTS